jgi:hypothetical protein
MWDFVSKDNDLFSVSAVTEDLRGDESLQPRAQTIIKLMFIKGGLAMYPRSNYVALPTKSRSDFHVWTRNPVVFAFHT